MSSPLRLPPWLAILKSLSSSEGTPPLPQLQLPGSFLRFTRNLPTATAAVSALLLLWLVLPAVYEHFGQPSGYLIRAPERAGGVSERVGGPRAVPAVAQGRAGDGRGGGEDSWHELCAELLFNHWTEAYGVEEGAKRKLRCFQRPSGPGQCTAEPGAACMKAKRGGSSPSPDVAGVSHASAQEKCADLLNIVPRPASAPSSAVLPPPLWGAPPAKHLQQCARATAIRGQWEKRGPEGGPPSWASCAGHTHGPPTSSANPPEAVHPRNPVESGGGSGPTAGAPPPSANGAAQSSDCTAGRHALAAGSPSGVEGAAQASSDCTAGRQSQCSCPCPPWVEGTDADNLPGTRRAQADIWLHQFPPDSACADPGHTPGHAPGSSKAAAPAAGATAAWGVPSSTAPTDRGQGMESGPSPGPEAGHSRGGGGEQSGHPAGGPGASGTDRGVLGPKFLLVDWDSCEYHGLGAQLHFMTHMLGLAMAYGRILVPLPGTYCRANHEGCASADAAAAGAGDSGDSNREATAGAAFPGGEGPSLTCYFQNFVSPTCERRALGLYGANASSHVFVGRASEQGAAPQGPPPVLVLGKRQRYSELVQALRGGSLVVKASLLLAGKSRPGAREAAVPDVWGTPWLEVDSLAALGEPPVERTTEAVAASEASGKTGASAGSEGGRRSEGGPGPEGGAGLAVGTEPTGGSGVRAGAGTGMLEGGGAGEVEQQRQRQWQQQQQWRLKILWWRAQGVRFLLRAPSAYLCHLLNLGRHQAYGMQVARDTVAGLLAARNPVAENTDTGSPMADSPVADGTGGGMGSLDPLARPFLPQPMVRMHVRGSDLRVEAQVYPFAAYLEEAQKLRERLLHGQSLTLGAPVAPVAPVAPAAALAPVAPVAPVAPAVALASACERGEGTVSGAHGASWHTVGLWLSSEEQAVFDEARAALGCTAGSHDKGGVPREHGWQRTSERGPACPWRLYTLDMEEKWRDEEMQDVLNSTVKALRRGQWEYALRCGLRDIVEASLVNLLISVESDGFVLSLSSNFNRLANELRITGGRLHSPIALVGPSRDW